MDHKSLKHLEEKSLAIIKSETQSNDSNSVTSAMILLAILLFISILSLYIKNGYSMRLIVFLVLMLVTFMIYKAMMRSAYAEHATHANYMDLASSEDKVHFIGAMLEYISSGYGVKLRRLGLLKWFYILNFPLFLVNMKELIGEGIPDSGFVPIFLSAAVFSFIIWSLFFYFEISEYKGNRMEVDAIISDLRL